MCIAVPGKVISIQGDRAKVDIQHNLCDVNIKLVSPEIGSYVLVHAGCAIEVMQKGSAEELLTLLEELEAAGLPDAAQPDRPAADLSGPGVLQSDVETFDAKEAGEISS